MPLPSEAKTCLRGGSGSGFGPPDDRIDGDAIVKLDTHPDMAFGFRLRDGSQPVHAGMLDLLRTAFAHDYRVTLDVSILDLKKNGDILRVTLTK